MSVPLGAKERARALDAYPLDPEGVVSIVAGSLEVLGHDASSGLARHVGAAPFDPPLPADFTVRSYIEWSARLADIGRITKSRVGDAIDRVGLAKAAKRQLRTLAAAERRALLLAHAVVASPAVIVAETPLADLDGEAATFVLTALSRVVEGRASIVSVARTLPGAPEAALLDRAETLLYFASGALVHAGSPKDAARGRRFGVTVVSNAEALKAELETRGMTLEGGPDRFTVELAEGVEPAEILRAASTARAAVVELLALM